MECTQRLESTDSYAGTVKRNPEQIGYLGIGGVKYPVNMGHNKIGRDPQACSIVLDFKSISRQHAVLVALNRNEITLMDMESANKTRVMVERLKTLSPYIPHPIKHGDTIQFGEMVGVFKLLEDDSDLPATQVMDIPDTPIRLLKAKHIVATTIPESPEVSDVENSFIIGSSSKYITTTLDDDLFVKPNSIQLHKSTNKIDNIYFNSSRKSKSLSLGSNSSSLNTSVKHTSEVENNDDIYDIPTQVLIFEQKEIADPIYSAETQLPNNNDDYSKAPFSTSAVTNYDNIHENETEALLPEQTVSVNYRCVSPSIHSLDTQISLPQNQNNAISHKVSLDLNLLAKENDDSIFNAETQLDYKVNIVKESGLNEDSKSSKMIEEDFTQCEDEDIFLSQQVQTCNKIDDDVTDCEDDITENGQIAEDIADMATQVLECNSPANINNNVDLADIPTQVLVENKSEQSENPTSEFSQEIISPFKIPLQGSTKLKKKDTPKLKEVTMTDDKYYKLTQDVYDDLCSQKEQSPIIESKSNESKENDHNQDEVLQCSQENYILGDKFPHIEAQLLSPKSNNSYASDGEKSINAFVSGLSKQDINKVIGVEAAPLKKVPSDSSDFDVTPKKSKPIRFSDLELPNSQDIKASVSLLPKTNEDTSSESETECSEDQNTPVLFRPKKKPKIDARKDLTKSFDVEALPTRILVRNRKALGKEPIDGVDSQIIHENIARLKIKAEKKKENKDFKKEDSHKVSVDIKDTKSKNDDTKNKKKKHEKCKTDVKKSKEKGNSKSSDKDDKVKYKSTSKRKNIDQKQEIEDKSSVENESRRSRRKKIETKRYTPSPVQEMEVRRSKRQQYLKETFVPVKEHKSILKKTDQSTVYNGSLESSVDNSRYLKRSAEKITEAPKPKRGRHAGSSRVTPARGIKTQYVLFTAFPSEEVQHKLEKLGAKVVTDVKQCTVVLTMQIKRTFKLLCAVGLGKPIVGPNWVQACVDTNMIVDPWLYLMKDERFEQRFQFSLERTLKGSRNYLNGYNISATPNVLPPASEMKQIVECSGGVWKEGGPRWVCVTCKVDKALWADIKKKGAALVSTEFILGGVLRQRLDIAANSVVT